MRSDDPSDAATSQNKNPDLVSKVADCMSSTWSFCPGLSSPRRKTLFFHAVDFNIIRKCFYTIVMRL